MDMVYAPPDGYSLDPESGLYYSSAMGADPETGTPVQWVTWFDANSGEYQQVCYPVEGQEGIESEGSGEFVGEQGEIESESAANSVAEEPAHEIEPEQMQTDEAEPVQEQKTEAEPAQGQTTETESAQEMSEWPGSVVPIPDGFAYDPEIKRYYIVTPGNSLDTGEYGQWVTYLDPDSGVYQQHFFPPQSE